jgi:hypothetical protein
MLASPPSAFAPPEDSSDETWPDADARARRQLRLLEALSDMGMDLARTLHRQVTEPGEDGAAPPADPGLAFARVSRAVRLTLALEMRVQGEMDARRANAASRPSSDETRSAVETLKQKLFAMAAADADDSEDDDEADACDAAETGWRELRERLVERDTENGPESGSGDDGRPVGEIIGDICRSLGGAPDWSAWADEDAAAGGLQRDEIAPPLGKLSAKPTEGDFDSPSTGARPLHHAARGPPPPLRGGGMKEAGAYGSPSAGGEAG